MAWKYSRNGSSILAEMVGINWRDFDVPDNKDASIRAQPVVEQGPAAYNADFPNQEAVAAMKAAGIPAAISYHAYTHMCNQMLYTASHLIERHGLKTRCGFIHVPLTPEHVACATTTEELRASMSLEMMTEAASIALHEAISENRATTRRSARRAIAPARRTEIPRLGRRNQWLERSQQDGE